MELFFAKLTYSETLFIENRLSNKELILLALTNASIAKYKKSQFIFIDIEPYSVGGNDFIYGKLAKYGDIEETIVNTESQKTESVLVEDKIIAKCHFIIDFSENYLLYTDVVNHINKNSFIEKFNDLIASGASETGYNIDARAINEVYTFYKKIEELKEIIQIELTIIPTNPNAIDIIQGVDKKLKLQNLKEKVIKYKGKKGGIQLDEEIKANTIYADVGYGTGKAIGIDKNNKRVTVYSKKSERQKRTPSFDSANLNGYGIVEKINKLLDDLKQQE
ncbi:MAG: hypothetical protein K9G49_03025 [Taibaiella sp.]|nr:hypothetical protein [Taibaiella sp.]